MKKILPIFTLIALQVQAEHDLNLNNVEVYGQYQPRSLLLDGMTESSSLQRQTQLVDYTASLLNFFTGVDTAANGGVSSLPIIRGLADDRINVKVDGVDLISACGNHMDPPTSYLDVSNLETVKVFAGITPVSMGGDSIGGSIILNSSKPKFATGDDIITASKVNGFYRSNNDARGGSFMTQFATDNFFAKYSGSYSEANNYYAGSNFKTSTYGGGDDPIHLRNDEVGSSGYRLENHNLNFAYKLNNHVFDVKLGYQKIPFQGFPNQRMDMTDNEQTKVNLSYFGDLDWGNLEARFFNHNTRQSMQFGSDKEYWYGTMMDSSLNVTPGMPMETRSETNGLNVKANYILSEKDILKTGLEYQRYRLEDSWPPSGTGMMSPRYMKNINDGERDRIDIFAEWERKWNPKWFTQAGLRHTHIETDAANVQTYQTTVTDLGSENFNAASKEKTFNNLDFSSVGVYTIDDTKTIEGGYAIKNRAPNLYELYAWNTRGMESIMNNWVGDGNGYVGNLNLDSETAHVFSISSNIQNEAKTTSLKITPHYSYVRDYIDANDIGDAGSWQILQFTNQDAKLYGLDLDLSHQFKTLNYGDFYTKAAVSYVRGENKETGDDLYRLMPLNLKLNLEQQIGSWTNSIQGQLVDEKTHVNKIRREMETSGYGLVHLSSSYKFSGVLNNAKLTFGIHNLFDKNYNLPLGGVYVGQGATMTASALSPNNATPLPGMGRSFNTAFSYEF